MSAVTEEVLAVPSVDTEDSLCPICKSDMGCSDFASSAEDQEVNDEIFRLKCGHAFHNGCLCRSLRNDARCPVCRGGGLREEQELRIIVDENGLLSIEESDVQDNEEDIAEANFNVEEARVVNETLITIGRNTVVQKARARVNAATKAYRKLEHTLFRERSKALRHATDNFRSNWRNDFEKARRDLKRTLKTLKKIETAEVAKVIEGVDLNAYINYDVEPHVGNKDTFGPLKHSFWMH